MKPEGKIARCAGCGTSNPTETHTPGEELRCVKCGDRLLPAAALVHPVAVSDRSFKAEVVEHPEPVLVDCWAEWCASCSAISRIMEHLVKKYAGRIKIAKLNVDRNPEVAVEYGILSLPTLLFFKAGEKKAALAGEVSEEEIVSWIDDHL